MLQARYKLYIYMYVCPYMNVCVYLQTNITKPERVLFNTIALSDTLPLGNNESQIPIQRN